MTQEPPTPAAGLGVCVEHNYLWVWTPDRDLCIMGDHPAPFVIPLPGQGAPAEDGSGGAEPPATAPAPPTRIGVTCPHCDKPFDLEITDDAVTPVLPPPTSPEAEASAEEPPPAVASATPSRSAPKRRKE